MLLDTTRENKNIQNTIEGLDEDERIKRKELFIIRTFGQELKMVQYGY